MPPPRNPRTSAQQALDCLLNLNKLLRASPLSGQTAQDVEYDVATVLAALRITMRLLQRDHGAPPAPDEAYAGGKRPPQAHDDFLTAARQSVSTAFHCLHAVWETYPPRDDGHGAHQARILTAYRTGGPADSEPCLLGTRED